jgi:hypothetical protein
VRSIPPAPLDKLHQSLVLVLTFSSPLNPPILGDFELRKVPISPQSWGAGGAKGGLGEDGCP